MRYSDIFYICIAQEGSGTKIKFTWRFHDSLFFELMPLVIIAKIFIHKISVYIRCLHINISTDIYVIDMCII